MILSFSKYGFEADINENTPTVIVIESSQVYCDFMQNLWRQTEGEAGEIVMFDNNKILSLSKVSNLIFNPYEIDCNNKKILNKIYQSINEMAQTEMTEDTMMINASISQYLEKMIEKIPFQLDYQLDLDIAGLLKLYDVKVRNDCEAFTERIIQYIKLMHQICNVCTFFFVHLKDYLTVGELQSLYESASYEKVNIILIESCNRDLVLNEKSWIIDNDLCIIEV